ncbi:MAG: heme exporter protein CcmD [Gammaproteobacteria bacterium]|jgi:heme exporter protein D
MPFESVEAFFAMGGHALYVWTAYGLTFVVMAVLAVWPARRCRRFFREEAMRQRRQVHAVEARVEEPR